MRMSKSPPSTHEMITTASRAESLQLKPAYPKEHCTHESPTALLPLGQALQLVFEYTMEINPSLQEQAAWPLLFVHVVVEASQGNGSCSHSLVLVNKALLSNPVELVMASLIV